MAKTSAVGHEGRKRCYKKQNIREGSPWLLRRSAWRSSGLLRAQQARCSQPLGARQAALQQTGRAPLSRAARCWNLSAGLLS